MILYLAWSEFQNNISKLSLSLSHSTPIHFATNFFSLDGWALAHQSLKKKTNGSRVPTEAYISPCCHFYNDRHFSLNFSLCTHCYIPDLATKPQATPAKEEGRLIEILPQLLCLLCYILLLSSLFSFFILFAYQPQFPLPPLLHSPLLRMGTASHRVSTKSGTLSWKLPSHSSHPIKAQKGMNREWNLSIELIH